MADFTYDEDEDAKADELPSDEEGDSITMNMIKPSSPKTQKPKIPPPVLGNFAEQRYNANNNVQVQLSSPRTLSPEISLSPPPSNGSNDNSYAQKDIMAFSPNMRMRVESKHIPSTSMPILPQFWACKVCTFAENSLQSPVCSICGALPAVEKTKTKTKTVQYSQQNMSAYTQLSPRANQSSHHQHTLWMHHTRQRHGNGASMHARTHSAHKLHSNQSNVNQVLPRFLESDSDEKESNPPSLSDKGYQKQKHSIASLVTKESASMSECDEQQMIVAQIGAISSKKELQIELSSVKATLTQKQKYHSTRIIALNKQKSTLASEYARQMSVWNKYYIILLQKLCRGYFEKLFALIDVRIEIEALYLQCFALKFDGASTAYNKLDQCIDEWDINDTRAYVKTTLFAVRKLRTSPAVAKLKKRVAKAKASINKMEAKYEAKKDLLNKAVIDDKKRSAYITLYLKTVIDEFNAAHKNIKLTSAYFCKADVQSNFNSFLLDQRVDVGKIVQNWLDFLQAKRDKKREILFKDIYVFIERLINTFCKVYHLDESHNGKYNYRQYCMRFTYAAVMNLELVNAILKGIAATHKGKKEYQWLSSLAEYTLFAHFLRLMYGL